jgi:hypothetical protein
MRPSGNHCLRTENAPDPGIEKHQNTVFDALRLAIRETTSLSPYEKLEGPFGRHGVGGMIIIVRIIAVVHLNANDPAHAV